MVFQGIEPVEPWYLPVLDKHDVVVGILTRKDLLLSHAEARDAPQSPR